MKNASSDVLSNVKLLYKNQQIKISEKPEKNIQMEKFNELFKSYENGKLDAKTLKGKLKTVI